MDVRSNLRYLRRFLSSTLVMLCFGIGGGAFGQTASTGAVTGIILDPSGSAVPGVVIHLTSDRGGDQKAVSSDKRGTFRFMLVPPGAYELKASKPDFQSRNLLINVHVTETLWCEFVFSIAARSESTQVYADPSMVQLDSVALGRVLNEKAVSGLPLATRNFAQIAGLSPGVVAGVYNAGELGAGGIALSQIAKSNDGICVHGARSYDNNFLLDGVSVSDIQGSASGSGGIPIPNPDAIQEFKVQTGLYDASFGRFGGANVSLVTKSGSSDFHATLFEFFRNEVLNSNDFFLSRANQPRPVLKQNQFGFSASGPIKKDALVFFGSYQGTRQVNGIAAGQSRTACTASLNEPALTNDRSPYQLGQLFGGMTGAHGGTVIKPDGSNINAVALNLLNFKLPDGSFLIPTPQSVDGTRPLAGQGLSIVSDPCSFDEDQFVANAENGFASKSQIAARLFWANDDDNVTFPGNGVNPSGNIGGFPSPSNSGFRVFSLAHVHAINSTWLNQGRLAYVRTRTDTRARTPFRWSDVGVAEGEMSHNNELPSLSILGSVSIASGFPRIIAQNSYILSDDLSFVRGSNALRAGGSLTRFQDNVNLIGLGSFVQFLSWPDFLLGLSAGENGSRFSNVFASFDDFGLTTREYRAWEGTGYAQDDYKIRKSVTLNLGLRYERLGQFSDLLGRNASFDMARANPNPPPEGSMAGYVVSSNFRGVVPTGVSRANNSFGNDGKGQNTIAVRTGFSWALFTNPGRLVLRGGYGTYYSRPTGQAFYQNILGAPFSEFRLNSGLTNAHASFQAPFPQPFPTSESFPFFPPYSPATATTIYSVSPSFQRALIQQYSLNAQSELRADWLLEIGYIGTRGTHLVRQRSLNQALPASAGAPIRSVTDNTVANISQRVPILGVPPDSLQEMESEGSSWYNGLETSLSKRLRHGFQFLLSYTFSKVVDTDGADINSTSSGNALTLGDQNSPRQRWGRASFDRTHRLVFSETWTLPSPASGLRRSILGGWNMAAVGTVQSGSALTIAYSNGDNVYGITEDRAQLSGDCSESHLVKRGSIQSNVGGYFNHDCFTKPPIIGADGIGTAFGNSSTGIVSGPGQANLDVAGSKSIALTWPRERSSLEFRAEFFNVFNHPQFADPDTNFTSPTFGVITSTSVNPRVGQLAVRFDF